jgi:hypothetical protein
MLISCILIKSPFLAFASLHPLQDNGKQYPSCLEIIITIAPPLYAAISIDSVQHVRASNQECQCGRSEKRESTFDLNGWDTGTIAYGSLAGLQQAWRLARTRTRSLATAAGVDKQTQFSRKLADGPSFDDFVGGDEITQGTRVSLGNLKTSVDLNRDCEIVTGLTFVMDI